MLDSSVKVKSLKLQYQITVTVSAIYSFDLENIGFVTRISGLNIRSKAFNFNSTFCFNEPPYRSIKKNISKLTRPGDLVMPDPIG